MLKSESEMINEEGKTIEEVEKEQKKTGNAIDSLRKNELFLRKHKKLFDEDDSLMLYRLPLSEEQRKEVFNSVMKKVKNKLKSK